MYALARVSGTHCNIRNGLSVNTVDLLTLQRNLIPQKKNERNLIYKAYFMIADDQHNTFALNVVNYN